MHYTIAVIENVQTNRKATLDAHGNKLTVWFEEGENSHHSARLDKDAGYELFYRLCGFVTESLHSFEDIAGMLDEA